MHAEHVSTAVEAVSYLRWIPALPFLAMLIHVCIGSRIGRRGVGIIACVAVAVSFVLALRGFLTVRAGAAGTVLVDDVYRWISAGSFAVDATLRLDALSAVMCLVISGVGLLIHVYSTGYMAHDPDYARYFAYLNLFTAAMLILVLADNLLVMFVGWEGVGLCSYLLIGFWYTDSAKASAGKKAFVVNRIGDAAFLLGMFVLFWSLADAGAGSLRFADINAQAARLAPSVALAAGLLLFVGATGKSAQLPLFVWLPDAMAGPTPVSALIHAATMVTAGVYMVARLSALYLAAPAALEVVAVVGAITALGAASVALVQTDIKKVLAYSTVSQLGYMFLALGVGAFASALFHVVTHAFFKALLFLGSGSVIHALHEEQDIRNMGGLRAKMPITSATFVVATLAIAGIPGFAGFFSKDEIVNATFGSGHVVLWGMAVAAAAMTAFYMTRLVALTFFGRFRGKQAVYDAAHESPFSMTSALIVLAVLSAFGGFLGVPHVLGGANRFGAFLAPILGHHELHIDSATEFVLMGVSVAVAVASMVLAWILYSRDPELDRAVAARTGGVYRALTNAYYVDRFYERGIAGSIVVFSKWLWRVIDVGLIDAVADGTATAAQALGDSWRRWTTGNVQTYALTLLVGVVVLVTALAFAAGGWGG